MAKDEGERVSDGFLIRLSLREPEAFTAIFERHAPSVLGYVSTRVPKSAVEDLVSDTFVIAFRSRSRYDFSATNARPWLFGIATNVLRHYERSERRLSQRLSKVRVDPAEESVAERVISDVMNTADAAKVRAAVDACSNTGGGPLQR
ncbi:MAG: RNA polymerase sigma factor [Nitrososphaerales archaeon]